MLVICRISALLLRFGNKKAMVEKLAVSPKLSE